MKQALVVLSGWAALVVAPVSAQSIPPRALQKEVSIAEIERTLHAIDVDRTAGSEGERAAADYLDRTLTELGVRHTRFDSRLYLSWPGRARVALAGLPPFDAKTAAFASPTPPEGVRGTLLLDPPLTRRVDQSLEFGPAVRGRIPVVTDVADTEALVLAGQRAGALAVVQIDATDVLHEDIVSTIWGSPTTETAGRLPAIPYVCIRKSDGELLRKAASAAPVAADVFADVTRGWRVEPNIVAEVPGRSPDFILVTTHVDAWYRGMTDTAGSVASILEMARVLQQHKGELARGVRFGWWTGHSFGRYAGSGWYVDRFWADLDGHCVAQTNLDGPGRRGSQLDAVSVSAWPGLSEYARESAERLTGIKPAAPRGSRPFRPGRDSDSAYQGIGVPYFSIGVPGPSNAVSWPPLPAGSPQRGGHADVDAAGRIVYWHTAEDTFDKLDLKALLLDTQYRIAQLYDLATVPALPHRLAPIAAAYRAALGDLAATGSGFDLAAPIAAADGLVKAAERFDAARRPADPAGLDAFNRVLVQLTHRLNSTLYTRTGRFDQDPAAELPILPLLARVKDLAKLPAESDEAGFLVTELLRGRNQVEWALRDATDAIDAYLAVRGK